MRVLLTGATGFIGSHVARLALAQGHEVIALVRPSSSLNRLNGVRHRLKLVEGDLRDAAALETSLAARAPEVCVHLAWYAEPGKYLEAHENIDCLTGSLALVRMLHRIGCTRLVIAGTSLEYQNSTRPVTETSSIQPTTLYAAAKHALSLTATNVNDSDEWSVVSARIFCVYGPWEDPRRLVPFVISKLVAGERCELSAADQIRDYLHVEDVASALFAVAKSAVDGPINIGSSQPVTVATIATKLGQLLNRPELLDFGARPVSSNETPYLVANTQRLISEVGWKARYDLGSGLTETVAWWRSKLAS